MEVLYRHVAQHHVRQRLRLALVRCVRLRRLEAASVCARAPLRRRRLHHFPHAKVTEVGHELVCSLLVTHELNG